MECLEDPNLDDWCNYCHFCKNWVCIDHEHLVCECETSICFQCEKEKVLKYCGRNCGKPVACQMCPTFEFEKYHKCEEN